MSLIVGGRHKLCKETIQCIKINGNTASRIKCLYLYSGREGGRGKEEREREICRTVFACCAFGYPVAILFSSKEADYNFKNYKLYTEKHEVGMGGTGITLLKSSVFKSSVAEISHNSSKTTCIAGGLNS